MRQRALEADLVVVNHHLLCADLVVKDGGNYGQVIPPYDTVILEGGSNLSVGQRPLI